MNSKLHHALLAGVAAAALTPAASFAQVFQSTGPGHASGSFAVIGSADNGPNGTTSGAVQAILADPSNADVIYVGSPNGGIWKSTDGGKDWTALTDRQASLSIDSLAFDPTDAAHQTIIGGVGITDNGAYDNFNRGNVESRGAARTGLLYSTDGGKDWADLGATVLAGQSVDAVAARGDVILAGTAETVYFVTPPDSTQDHGLYRSTDGGKTFNLVSGAAGTGLPAGPVTSIVGDPNNPSRLYAAVTAPDTSSYANTGVYVSNDTGGHWTRIFGASDSGGAIQAGSQTMIKLAVGPGGSVAIGLIDLSAQNATGVFLSKDNGATWASLPVPNTNPGGQAPPNFAIAIDPHNNNLVYLSGDNICDLGGCNNAVAAYRINANTSTISRLGDSNGTAVHTAHGTTIHPDSRALTFDASGRLLISSDGGIYARTNPQNNTGDFIGLNGNLSVFEPYSVAFDAVSGRMAVSAQDAGSAIQTHAGSSLYTQVGGGDGINAQVNDRSLAGFGVFYTAFQSYGGFQRNIYNASGALVSPLSGPDYAIGVPITCNGGSDCGAITGASFSSPFTLNKVDPTRIALAGGDVFLTQDSLSGAQGVSATSVDLTLTDIGSAFNTVSALSYGTRDNHNALLAADYSANLFLSTTGAPGSLNQLVGYNVAGGAVATSVVFDIRTAQRFFVADSYKLFGTTDQGATFQDLTSNLPRGFTQPTSVEFVSFNGVNALLVGGLNQPTSCPSTVNGCLIPENQSPITVADSNGSGALSNWRAFGLGLPNAIVNDLNYDQAGDVLAVSTVGRGAWLLYDFTSYFPQATQLLFGLANNDSAPDASFLTDGTTGGRPLVKYGSGTLLIDGAAAYTGGTTIADGVLQLGSGGTAGSILGDVSNDGVLVFDRSDVLTFPGAISGTGEVVQYGPGTTVLTSNNSWTGGTSILNGALQLGNGGTGGGLTGDVDDESQLVFDRSDTVTFPGIISGAGGVTQLGSGKTILTGANTYSGWTSILAGTLQIGDGGTSGAAPGDVLDNGQLVFDRSDAVTYSGQIVGNGSLTQAGSGTLVLTDSSGYTGGTSILAGALELADGAGGGAIVGNIVDNGQLLFDRSGNFLVPGAISGTGSVTQQGAGITILTGDSSYTGGTRILAGGLQLGYGGTSGSVTGDVLDNGQLIFDRSDDLTFAGNITGTGSVIMAGSGMVTLTGNNSYAATDIANGVLNVNGVNLSSMLVGPGGVLSGNGVVGPVTVQAGGTFAPGDAVGTLTVTGNLTLAPGSQFVVRIEGPVSDRATVTGSASIAGSATAVFAGGGYVHQYNLLSAAGGLTGTFSSFTAAGAPRFLQASLAYTSSSVLLNLSSELASLSGLNRNQLVVATSLDTAFNSGGGSIPGLFSVSDAALPAALSALSGEGIASTQEVAFGAADVFTRTLVREGLVSGDAGTMGRAASRSGGDGPWHAWATGYDQAGSLDGKAAIGSSTVKHQTGGLAGGFDYRTEDGLVFGLGVGGTFSSLNLAALATHGSLNGVHAGVFAEKTWPTVYTVAALGYGSLSTKTTRSTMGIGAPGETETGGFTDSLFSGRLEAGWRQTGQSPVSPFAAIGFSRLWQGAVAETSSLQGGGAGTLGLDVASANAWSVASELGAQAARSWTTRSGATWTPYLRLSWQHEFEPGRSVLATFQSVAGAPAFRVDAARAASNAARIEAGTGLELPGRVSLFVNADGAFAGRAETYGGRAGLRVSW